MPHSRFDRARSLSPFTLFVGAAGCANLADGIRAVALPLLAVALTRDPALVAGLGVAQSLPFLVAGLPAGLVADRVDRRRLVVSTNLIEAGLFSLLVAAVLADAASIPLLYVVAFCLGTNETLRDTAMSTAVPALVPPNRFEWANGRLVTVGFVGQQLAGPAVGGALFAVAITSPFALSAALTVAAAGLVASLSTLNRDLPTDRPPEDGVGEVVGAAVVGWWGELREGLAFLARHQVLRTLVLLAVVLAFTDAAWFAILVLFVTDELGLAEWTYGAMLAAAAGGGAAGGWTADRIIRRIGPARSLRGSLIVIGVAQAAIGLSRGPVLLTTMLAVGNAGFGVWLTAAASQRHALTPDRLLGRVTGVWRTASLGAIPVGMFCGGFLARWLGLRAPFLAGAPLVIGAAILARAITSRSLAEVNPPPHPPSSFQTT
jgi:MFS family permease